MEKIKSYLKLMRVHHYIKNLLIFSSLLFSRQVYQIVKLRAAFLGFLSFCMIASCIYIVNDIRDIDEDKRHIKKCKRPIASGKVKIGEAKILACILFIISIFFSYRINMKFSYYMLYLILYFILNIFYSLGLKNVPIADVTILASGFCIRVSYGAAITGIEISKWFYLTIVTISLFFAFGKRRNELLHSTGEDVRKVLKIYNKNFLDKNMYMFLTLANGFYALWSMEKVDVRFSKSRYIIYTVPIVLLITSTYSFNIETYLEGDPVEVLLNSKALMILTSIYFLLMFIIFYL